MTYSLAFALAILAIAVSGLGHGRLGLLLVVVGSLVAIGAYVRDSGRERRDARRRNRR